MSLELSFTENGTITFIDTKEKMIQYALMTLGWTPPNFDLEMFEQFFDFMLFRYTKHLSGTNTNWVNHKRLYEKLDKEKAEFLLNLAMKVEYHHPERVEQIKNIINSKN